MVDYYNITVYYLFFLGIFLTIFYTINLFLFYKKHNYQEATNKTVSIIIPAYNEEKSIEKTIISALSLDYPANKFEIIVIDDGSKDKTYYLAKKFERNKSLKIRVLKKTNGGKGSALNLGIKNSKGEIIVTMDADTFTEASCLKKMIGYFYNRKIAAVVPSIGVYKPKSIWQRIQQIEYAMGVFLRKSFATTNSIHVTPGAFSAYRKSFFDKYGGYDEKNITEDLEIALRIQSKNLIIENSPNAIVYTITPNSFKDLLIQRRRWYSGLLKNLWNYRCLFNFKNGPLGVLILPSAVITITLATIIITYSVIKRLIEIKKDLIYLNAINFKFQNLFDINLFIFQKHFFNIFSQPIFLFTILLSTFLIAYLYFSKKNNLESEGVKLNFFLFLIFYSILFSIWWIVSFIYTITNKKISWRSKIEA